MYNQSCLSSTWGVFLLLTALQMTYSDPLSLLTERFFTKTIKISRGERMQNVLSTADKIVVTHEHYDHIGGTVKYPNPAGILPNVILAAT
ncbi:MAG: phosphoribosyl 1,2-cyclic phosphodiesterase [Cellvibrionaceae bacterium]|jgi:phosphoribosyl 1,2-cyclic phosphodiesterase